MRKIDASFFFVFFWLNLNLISRMDFNRRIMVFSVSVLGLSLATFLFAYMVYGGIQNLIFKFSKFVNFFLKIIPWLFKTQFFNILFDYFNSFSEIDNTDEDLRTLRQTNVSLWRNSKFRFRQLANTYQRRNICFQIIFRHGAKFPDRVYEKDFHLLKDVQNTDPGKT